MRVREVKVKCIDERVRLLHELPPVISLKSMPPPGAHSQIPNSHSQKTKFCIGNGFQCTIEA